MIDTPNHTIHSSTLVEASPDTVWHELRDIVKLVTIVFGPAVRDVHWADGGSLERVPARYNFTMLPVEELAQQEIVGRDELARSVTYRAVAPVLCVLTYVGRYRVVPVTNDPDRCYVEWTREFTIAEDAVPEVVEAVIEMMENQINNVRTHFAEQTTKV